MTHVTHRSVTTRPSARGFPAGCCASSHLHAYRVSFPNSDDHCTNILSALILEPAGGSARSHQRDNVPEKGRQHICGWLRSALMDLVVVAHNWLANKHPAHHRRPLRLALSHRFHLGQRDSPQSLSCLNVLVSVFPLFSTFPLRKINDFQDVWKFG